jgi:hypothetical protein
VYVELANDLYRRIVEYARRVKAVRVGNVWSQQLDLCSVDQRHVVVEVETGRADGAEGPWRLDPAPLSVQLVFSAHEEVHPATFRWLDDPVLAAVVEAQEAAERARTESGAERGVCAMSGSALCEPASNTDPGRHT